MNALKYRFIRYKNSVDSLIIIVGYVSLLLLPSESGMNQFVVIRFLVR